MLALINFQKYHIVPIKLRINDNRQRIIIIHATIGSVVKNYKKTIMSLLFMIFIMNKT